MPKITKGGVSNATVHPDFIAEPGTPVERALDEGLPDVGQLPDDEDSQDEGAQPMGNEFPAHDEPPKKTAAPKKNTTPSKR